MRPDLVDKPVMTRVTTFLLSRTILNPKRTDSNKLHNIQFQYNYESMVFGFLKIDFFVFFINE